MPLIVTDADVLAQVHTDDGAANAIDGAITSLGAKVPPAMLANWQAYLAGYRAWSKETTDQVSGGFFGGAWFGVPELGDQAIAKGRELAQWQANVNAVAAGQAAPVGVAPVDPNDVANANASVPGLNAPATGGVLGPGGGLDPSTKLLLAAGLGVLFYALWKK